jgi:hypothetical protein
VPNEQQHILAMVTCVGGGGARDQSPPSTTARGEDQRGNNFRFVARPRSSLYSHRDFIAGAADIGQAHRGVESRGNALRHPDVHLFNPAKPGALPKKTISAIRPPIDI